MSGRYTSQFPKIGFISPLFLLPLAGMVPALMFKASVAPFIYAAMAVVALEILVKVRKAHSLGGLMRRTISIMLMGIFGRGMKSTPVSWRRRHFPHFVALFAFVMSLSHPPVVWAEYDVTDSLRWDRDLRAGSIGMSEDDVVSISCQDCPLKLGLTELIPTDFNVLIDDDVSINDNISYNPGRPWGSILNDIARDNDLSIEIHRHGNRVIVENSPTNRGAVNIVSMEPRKSSFYDTKTWELIPGDTLDESLKRWARSEGWNVIFEVNDVAIDVPAVFEGNLIEAINSVFASYRASGRYVRVQPQYSHANNVILIQHQQGEKE